MVKLGHRKYRVRAGCPGTIGLAKNPPEAIAQRAAPLSADRRELSVRYRTEILRPGISLRFSGLPYIRIPVLAIQSVSAAGIESAIDARN